MEHIQKRIENRKQELFYISKQINETRNEMNKFQEVLTKLNSQLLRVHGALTELENIKKEKRTFFSKEEVEK